MLNRSYIQGHERHSHYLSDLKILSLQRNIHFSEDEEVLIRVVKHLSDPTKLKIYFLLHNVEEIPVTDITHILHISQSAASHALSDLRNFDLVESHRCGQLICYSLKKSKIHNKFLRLFYRFLRT